jgi:murein tripeptide amidase MpaA
VRREGAIPFSVSSHIPGGSIGVERADDPTDIRLRLMPDAMGAHGWFHYRVNGLKDSEATFNIVNAGLCVDQRLAGREDYDNAWHNTGPVASYDRRFWFRVPGKLAGSVFTFRHTPLFDCCYYAQWAPYSAGRELDSQARWQLSSRVRLDVIGRSVDGADIDRLTVGQPGPGKKICWIIGRQHPSEQMSGFFIEGLVDRLLDERDSAIRDLLDRAVFYIVPNMNPDGARRAYTRSNAAGVNLNRAWVDPDPAQSPEVWWVRGLMELTGVDFAMDCHGDEELRCNFLGGPLEIPSRSARLAGLFGDFEKAWAAITPAYELGHPYPGGSPAEADLKMAWNWIAERFNCLSILLEQPFKDTSCWPDTVQGWSPERAYAFGTTLPRALAAVVEQLR